MSHLEEARRVLNIEAQSLLKMAEALDERFNHAVEMIFGCTGKVIVTGIGKSGHVGRKFLRPSARRVHPPFLFTRRSPPMAIWASSLREIW